MGGRPASWISNRRPCPGLCLPPALSNRRAARISAGVSLVLRRSTKKGVGLVRAQWCSHGGGGPGVHLSVIVCAERGTFAISCPTTSHMCTTLSSRAHRCKCKMVRHLRRARDLAPRTSAELFLATLTPLRKLWCHPCLFKLRRLSLVGNFLVYNAPTKQG